MNFEKMLRGLLGMGSILLLAGCGSAALSPNLALLPGTDKAVVVEVPALKQMEAFNTRIAEVKDEATAGTAIETFSTHVASEMSGSGLTPLSQKSVLSPAVAAALSRKEVQARADIRLHGADSEAAISSEKIATVLNELIPESAANPIRVDEIEVAKEGVRAELPAMSPDKIKNMTPLEAMVVGYSFVTGDKGNGETRESSAQMTQTKIDQFVQGLLEEEKQ